MSLNQDESQEYYAAVSMVPSLGGTQALELHVVALISVCRCIRRSAQFYHREESRWNGKCKLLTECKPFPFPAAQRLPPTKVSMGL